MIALYLVQRAFHRDTAAAFALCGVGVGVLINLRIMGALLFAAVVGLRALDLLLARNRAARRRAAVTTAAFALAAAGTLYAVSPYLWGNPLAIADAFTGLASVVSRLFQGRWVRWPSIPPHYLPTWMAITTPPATLLLCLIGAAAALGRGITRPGSLLRYACMRNTRMRFEWLLVACLTLPIAAVIALNSNIYDGWRQMYFLYAPACLLAVCGLRAACRRAQTAVTRGSRLAAARALCTGGCGAGYHHSRRGAPAPESGGVLQLPDRPPHPGARRQALASAVFEDPSPASAGVSARTLSRFDPLPGWLGRHVS